MASDRDLNTLHRFRKQSGRLVLEQHSHCEVPAGCGGVVLRWRDPKAARPLRIHCYMAGKASCTIDGSALPSGAIDLAPGPHVVTFVLEDVDLGAGLLLWAAVFNPASAPYATPPKQAEPAVRVVSTGDETWLYTIEKPPAAWQDLAFVPRGFSTLVPVPIPATAQGEDGGYLIESCRREGAVCLGVPMPTLRRLFGRAFPSQRGTVFVRKRFEVPMLQER